MVSYRNAWLRAKLVGREIRSTRRWPGRIVTEKSGACPISLARSANSSNKRLTHHPLSKPKVTLIRRGSEGPAGGQGLCLHQRSLRSRRVSVKRAGEMASRTHREALGAGRALGGCLDPTVRNTGLSQRVPVSPGRRRRSVRAPGGVSFTLRLDPPSPYAHRHAPATPSSRSPAAGRAPPIRASSS
jgi:hypothetical protein